MNSESQEYFRKNPRVPVTIAVQAGNGSLPLSFATNISASGMRIEIPQPSLNPEIGSTIFLRFNLPFGSQPIEVEATIRSVEPVVDSHTPITHIGVEFTHLTGDAESEINAYIQRYRSAQESRVTQIQQDPNVAATLETHDIAHYLTIYKQSCDKASDDYTAYERQLHIFVNQVSVGEISILNNSEVQNAVIPPAVRLALRNALGLIIKLNTEMSRLEQLCQENPDRKPSLVAEFSKIVSFETDICMEGLQELQSQAMRNNQEILRKLCGTIRERLTATLVSYKKRFQGDTDSSNTPVEASQLDGPWGTIYDLDHYQRIFTAHLNNKLDNPIEVANIERFLKNFHSQVRKCLDGTASEAHWQTAADAVLLSFKFGDELQRLRQIEGRQVEHLDTIRNLFKYNAKLVATYHDPLRNYLNQYEDLHKKELDDATIMRIEVYEQVASTLFRIYSLYSDFANQLIPGTVAISEENAQYGRGAFVQAVAEKAKKVKRWAIRRQKYLIVGAIVMILAGGAFHVYNHFEFRKPIDIATLKPPFPLLNSYASKGVVTLVIDRTLWSKMEPETRQLQSEDFFRRVRETGFKGLKMVSPTNEIFAQTLYTADSAILSVTLLPDDPLANPETNQRSR